MKKLSLVLILFSSLLTGCANKFETRKFDSLSWTTGPEAVEGVIYYEPRLVKIHYKFTALVSTAGELLGMAPHGCAMILQKQEIRVLPNFTEPRVIINRPSYFASGKLGVVLKDGMLISVNSESNPELSEIIKEVTVAAGMLGVAPSKSGPQYACNAAPEIRDITSL